MEKKIEKAKAYAQEEYFKSTIKNYAHNPNYKREWKEVKTKDKNQKIFTLTGTPDKAFVVVDLKKKEAIAMNQIREVLKVFK